MTSLHEHIILPLGDMLRGEQVYKYLKLLREAEGWSPEQMADYQQKRLRNLFVYAAAEVPFYHDWFHKNNIDPQIVTLGQLPIVSKSIMRQEGIDRFTSDHFPVKRRILSRSSGSTGEPFSFYVSKEANSVNTAAKLRTWYMGGYRLGDRYMKIANGTRHSSTKKLQDLINRCIYVPFYSVSDEVLKSILDQIEHSRPTIIRSYPIPLYMLAQYRNHHSSYSFCPKHLMTTGSTLPEIYRTEIEKAFGCDIIDSYSCEGTPNTYETPSHDGYNVCNFYGIIEVLDDNDQPVTNGTGHVVSTDLWNLAHPFIRYDTQDLVEVKNNRIMRILGRECDALVSANTMTFTVHNFSHFFLYEISGIDCYQIVKKRDNSIKFNIVVNKEYNNAIKNKITDHWSRLLNSNVSVELVDSIPLMKNNKRLTIVEE